VRCVTIFDAGTVDEILKLGTFGDVNAGPKSFTLQLEHASITVVSCDPSLAPFGGVVTMVV